VTKSKKKKMFSSMFGIRPNPNYTPGGTENFWISSNSEYQKTGSGSNTLSQNLTLEKSISLTAGSKEYSKESSGVSSLATLPKEKNKEVMLGIKFPGLQVSNGFCFNMIQNSWTLRKIFYHIVKNQLVIVKMSWWWCFIKTLDPNYLLANTHTFLSTS